MTGMGVMRLFIVYLFNLFSKNFSVFYIDSRESEREGDEEEERHCCEGQTLIGCLSHTPRLGLKLQPRHVPWPGSEPVTFWFAG